MKIKWQKIALDFDLILSDNICIFGHFRRRLTYLLQKLIFRGYLDSQPNTIRKGQVCVAPFYEDSFFENIGGKMI